MDDNAVRLSHLIDDTETLRTHALRTLLGQTDLLTDALHALRNGSPDVTDEFVDRVRGAIDAEIVLLRAGAAACDCRVCAVPRRG